MKLFIQKEIPFEIDWGYGTPIGKLKSDIEELERLGATHVEFEASESYGCATLEIRAIHERQETDEEEAARLKGEEDRKIQAANEEIQLLKKLKSKYPNV